MPWLFNSQATFDSDEAVDALVILHLMRGHELTLFNWDTRYYGIVEGLMATPLLALGMAPELACKLASFAGFLALLWALFVLGRRLYGVHEGLAAAALAAVFSPQVVAWSVKAAGGYALIVAWGTFALLQLDRTLRRPSGGNLLALGAVLGFGLYIYELFLIYLVAIALAAAALALGRVRRLRRPVGERDGGRVGGKDGRARAAARGTGAALLLATGFAVGFSPKLAARLGGAGPIGKQPSYMLASGEQVVHNLQLLVSQCIPSFFGVNPARHPGLTVLIGYTSAPRAWLGVVVLSVYAAAWGLALRRVGKWLVKARAARPAAEEVMELALVLLVAVTIVVFLASPNPQNAWSNRYLLPLLSSLPLLAGRMLVVLARRRGVAPPRQTRWIPLLTGALWLLLVGLPLAQLASFCRIHGLLDTRYRLARRPEPLAEVVRFLEREGIAGGYGDYWTAYKATLLARERVVIAPHDDWDRYPAYSRRVDRLPAEAYIVHERRAPEQAGALARRLIQEGRLFTVRRFGRYLVFTSPRHARLLPFVGHPEPLLHPRAAVTAQVPAALAAGETVQILATVRNQGDATWPAAGGLNGWCKVDLAYRWSDAAGREVVSEGLRSALPRDLEPDSSVELALTVAAPVAPGRYRLLITAVQEGVFWFDRVGAGVAVYPVEVLAPGARRPLRGSAPSAVGTSTSVPPDGVRPDAGEIRASLLPA